MTPYAALLQRIRTDPSAPLITYRDLESGERMELSAASLGNAIAKTAGLLIDELGVEVGARVGVHLPLHWQRVVWLGACAATSTAFVAQADPRDCDILVVDRSRLHLRGIAPDDVLVSLAPFGLPDGGHVPSGVIEAAVAMRGHPDTFMPLVPPTSESPWWESGGVTVSLGDAMDLAGRALTSRGVDDGTRFALVDDDPEADILALAGPLASGGSVVLVAHPSAGDLGATLREEGIDAPEE